MQVEVLRPIQKGGGEIIPAGTVLDASAWTAQRLAQLVEQRYVVPVMLPVPSERTRRTKGAEA